MKNTLRDGVDLNSSLTGIAGVHFVAAELAVKGIISAVTSRNAQGIDIIASRPDGSKSISIQVKTSKKCEMHWMLNKKAEDLTARNFFYVFVDLKFGTEKPAFYVVPSAKVARLAKEAHRKWLRMPGRDGRKHADGNMRGFWFDDEKAAARHCNRWDLLGL